MNILIITVGTQGDVQPYVALGKGLKASGHSVTVCTCAYFESFVTAHGLDYAFMNDDLIKFMHSDDGKIAMENTGNLWEAIRTAIKIIPTVGPMQRRQIDDSWQATQAVHPDLVLYHPKALCAPDFAERLNVPSIIGFYLPLFAVTGDFPAMGLPRWKLGRWYNRFTHRLINKATWWGMRKHISAWRKENNMPRKQGIDFLNQSDGQPAPALYAFSESVIPRPSDWPENARVSGYWFLNQIDDWEPPAELQEFLANGASPIYFGFGSIFGQDPLRLTKIIVEAVKTTGARAILARGWGGLDLDQIELPETIFKLNFAPHDWLFPQVAAVVHHGGCGTTAAGLRAGRPSILCPFFGDQPFWGSIIENLGVGPTPLPQKKLTVEKLSTAIRQVTTDTAMIEKADQIGQRIRSEDGVANAVEFIDQWLARYSESSLVDRRSDGLQ
ncbi:glycosyltransferase [Gimesia aquarii]|uniref:MurG-like transferase n=1 Tax=Gimesia aquarii TaxID=2527964 RepID=A0A517VZ12_9PLAN|nr:glycosyltransferase [Gimesia aquarii]QDT98220.1 MurG-like transferase [Gimesia aquarii]